LTDLERAGRLLVAREPVPITPVEQIHARAARVAAQRARRRRRVIALAAAAVVVIGAATWALTRSASTHEPVATTPAPSATSTTAAARSTTVPPTTAAFPPVAVTAARLTRADLGMAATVDEPDADHAHLWLTRDGHSWSDVTPTIGISGPVEDLLALDPLHLWATSWDPASVDVTVWRSADGGHTWAHTIVGPHSAAGASHLQFADPEHGWVELYSYSGNQADLLATTDGGATWTRVTPHLPEDGELMFYTPTDGYLGSDPSLPFGSGLFVTHDAGRTWRAVTLPFDERSLPNPKAWDVGYGVPTFVDDSTGVLPITVSQGNIAGVEWWETNDGGASWHLRTPLATAPAGIYPNSESTTSPVLTSVTGPHVWWAVLGTETGTRTERTVDAGAHWSAADGSVPSRSPTWFGAANADVAWMLGNGLYATTDGGHSWTRIDPPG
jgi:photosystem II stability/assembly factor-like uncharacterized protein